MHYNDDIMIDEIGATKEEYGIMKTSSAEPKLREIKVPKVSLLGKTKFSNPSESTNKESI